MIHPTSISLKCSHKYFYSTYNSLSPQNNFFQNCQLFSNCEPYDMYISLSFLYKPGTLEAHISLHSDIYFLHMFCLGMFSIHSGWSNMVWQMNPPGEGISLKCSKLFLYMSFSVHSKFFFKMVNFSATENHLKFTFLSDVYTNLKL